MKTKPKTIAVVLGSLSGALITALFTAFDFWIFTYTDTRTGFLGYYYAWAWLAAIVGAVIGFVSGAVLGAFLSFMRQGPLLGAFAGTIGSVALLFFFLVTGHYPTGDERGDLTMLVLAPVGAVSGVLTSLVVAEITSWANERSHPRANQRRDSYVTLGLRRDKPDESAP